MRFVWAVVAFVLATVMIGAGIAQRTILRGPETVSESVAVAGDAPFTLLEGDVLTSRAGSQTLSIRGEGTVFAAYGRTADVEAWLSRTEHNRISVGEDGEATVSEVAATATPAPNEDGTAAPMPSPVGSDLWLEEFQQEDALQTSLQLPEEMSLVIASDGTAPAPADIEVTWPIESNTPWAGPLIVLGGVLLLFGIIMYALGWRHLRRSRGPRRKGIPMTETQPIDISIENEAKGVISARPPRRKLTRGRQALVALPLVSIVALTGCSADAWPQLAPTATPSPTTTVVADPDQAPPAVTEQQAERILSRIAEDVSTADGSADAALAATRLSGPALAERETNYTLRSKITDRAPLPPIPAEPLEILLPETFEQWPRTFLAVVEGSDGAADTIMTVSQQDPWSNYKLGYIAELATNTFPELAPSYLGAAQVAPDSPFLVLAPQDLAAAYADLLTNGDASPYAQLFEAEGDAFRDGVTANREQITNDFNQTGAETGSVSFTTQAGDQAPIALQTLESGAIVAVTITEDHTFKPSNPDAVINVPDTNPVASALTGVSQSSTGFTTTYADQLFFFVPGAGSSEPIQFLGYRSNVLSAKVV